MLIKKSITIKRHRTSVSLEKEFWDALSIISKEKKISVEKLIFNIDIKRESSLASSIRVFVLQYFLK
jgi:predicted DNA-binding ribbon-helix-helix protein|tara:strand:- start:500 stop:700 length:201 start_codon:yes stop_codon:yes gene_type:complete